MRQPAGTPSCHRARGRRGGSESTFRERSRQVPGGAIKGIRAAGACTRPKQAPYPPPSPLSIPPPALASYYGAGEIFSFRLTGFRLPQVLILTHAGSPIMGMISLDSLANAGEPSHWYT